MEDKFYIRVSESIYGPSTKQEIETLLRENKISRDDFVSLNPDGPWNPISTRAEFGPRTIPISELMRGGRTEPSARPAEESRTPPARPAAPDGASGTQPGAAQAAATLGVAERERYVTALSKKGETIAFVLAVLAMGYLAKLVLGAQSPGWLKVAAAIVVVGAGPAAAAALRKIRRKVIEGTYGDEQLIEEYRGAKRREAIRRFGWVAAGVALAGLYFFNDAFRGTVRNIFHAAGSKARCTVSNTSGAADSFVTNGEADFGYTVVVDVKNSGEAGDIILKVKLSSSEGEWQREQTVRFGAGQSQELKFGFSEPSINATNIRYGVQCLP
jgi:hypothetical protein